MGTRNIQNASQSNIQIRNPDTGKNIKVPSDRGYTDIIQP